MTTTPTKNESLPESGSWVAADDVYRHARSIDVALNGEEGAAPRPALCDVVAQIASLARKHGPLTAALTREAPTEGVDVEALRAIVRSWEGGQSAVESMAQFAATMGQATPRAPQRLAQGDAQFADNGADADCACTFLLTRDGVTYCGDCGLTITQPPHHDRGEVEDRERILDLYTSTTGMHLWSEDAADKVMAFAAALTEAKQQGPGEAGSPSLKQTPAWWVGYSIGHTGRAPYHCIGPDKPPSQYANDSVHWTPLYTAPQVEAKRQTGGDA